MMRLLYLCLLLRAAAVSSQEIDGSGDTDDEDDVIHETFKNTTRLLEAEPDFDMKEATGHEDSASNELFTIIIVGVCLVALLAVAVAAVVLVRRHKHNREQGIYSVPAEQGQKGAV